MLMKSHQILRYLKACSYCGSLQITESGLCTECFHCLQRFHDAPKEVLSQKDSSPKKGKFGDGDRPPIESNRIQAYYSWKANESNMLSVHLKALKGASSAFAWTYYGVEMARKWRPHLPHQGQINIVYPRSRTLRPDHAHYFARAIGAVLGAPIFSLRHIQTKRREQKKLSLQERSHLEFGLDEKISDLIKNCPDDIWIFVDDVYTTGATQEAVKKALGNPKNMYTWVLAKRTL